MTARTKGFCTVMISAIFFGLMPMFAKIVCAGGGNVICIAFYRFFISLLPLFIYLKVKKISFSLSRKELRQITLITVCGYGGTAFLLYLSYDFIPSGMATTIHFVYPVFVILGSILFLKVRPEPLKLLCVALCMGGILLFSNGQSGDSVIGVLIAFASGITYAFYVIYLDRSGLQKIPTLKLIFYMNSIASVILLIGNLATGYFTVALSPTAWISMTALAVGASFIGVCLFQKGMGVIGPQNAAILSTFEPITSLLMGVILFHESFTLQTAVGCVLILISVVIVAKTE